MRRWFRRCEHQHIRCTHGDEINERGGRRRVCLDCGRSLEGDLPLYCYQTGKLHFSYVNPL